MTQESSTQIAIVGGGVCGLWLLASLLDAGYQAVLIERESLGGVQTLSSQGMIHGGIKYALGGFTTTSSETIAAMPQRWKDCIQGSARPDLREVALLSDSYYLFSDHSLSSRVTAFFGSKSIRGRIEPVKSADLPACFSNPAFKGTVYRLEDIVVDTVSLVSALASRAQGRIFKSGVSVATGANGVIEGLDLDSGRLVAGHYIFAAGAGNEALIGNTVLAPIAMQRRPLHQVMVMSNRLPAIYAHAVSASAGAKPRVTFTTHPRRAGQTVWYLGGNLAETGIHRAASEQVEFAKHEVTALFPWLDFSDAEWRSFFVDRAEPAQQNRARPDRPFFHATGNGLVLWPTKLSLAPLLADEVIATLPGPTSWPESLPPLPAPPVGTPPWETAF